MTIGTPNRNDYIGNNAAATYSFTFKIFAATDLQVTTRDTADVETELSYPSGYTVSGSPWLSGGSITLTAGNLPSGYVLAIRRVRPLMQTTDLRNQASFFAEVHEDTFDDLVMKDQQQQDALDRALKLPVTVDPADFNPTLPVPEAGKAIGWNADGSELINYDTSAISISSLDAVNATFLQTGTGAVTRSVRSKLREDISVVDFGADRSGTLDSTTAFTNALVAAGAGGRVKVPAGTYKITHLTISQEDLTLFGEGAAELVQPAANASTSVIAIVASGVTIDTIEITGVVTVGTEADEELACIHITWSGSVVPLSDITIKNCYLTGKVAGIFTNNLDNTNTFALTNIKFIGNTVRALQYGIIVNAYLQSTILHTGILFQDNDIEVSALGGYGSFYNARPLMAWNANDVIVTNNKTTGGFSCIDLISSPASSLAHRYGNQVIGNRGDSHLSFTQTDGGVLANNIVDMALRDPDGEGWPAYDHATVVAQYGYLPGIEASDNFDMSVTGNTVRDPVGDCIDYGGNRSCSCTGNNLSGAGSTAGTPANAHGIIIRYGSNLDSVISHNTIRDCARSGISQDTGTNWVPIERMKIINNAILNVQEHGIHIHNTSGITISHNGIKNANLAAGTFNGIDFAPAYVGNAIIAKCDDNTIDGCYRAIYQPYIDPGSNRLSQIRKNTAISHSATNAFLIYGRRSENWAPVLASGYVAPIVGTHVDFNHGLDTVYIADVTASIAYLDNLSMGDKVTIFFLGSLVTLTNAVDRMNLAGSVDAAPTAGSIFRFQCMQDATHLDESSGELSRMIR